MKGCTRNTPRCEYWTQGDDYLRPACCTEHLTEILFFTHALLERHGIPHWLDFGSLLGAARSGELIPWDGDTDFGVFREDLDRIRALAPEVEAAGFWLNMESPYAGRVEFSRSNSLHADLFPWWLEDGLLKMRWPNASNNTWAFPPHFVENLQPVTLCGGEFPAPFPLQPFLERFRYGPDYMVPLRTEQLDLKARLAPAMRGFVAVRIYRQRLEQNIALLGDALSRTPLHDLYRVADAGVLSQICPGDRADAAFIYSGSDSSAFLKSIPAVTAAGFKLLSQEGKRTRFAKDGSRFDFVSCDREGGAA